jgi:hypothetical protein
MGELVSGVVPTSVDDEPSGEVPDASLPGPLSLGGGFVPESDALHPNAAAKRQREAKMHRTVPMRKVLEPMSFVVVMGRPSVN